MTDSIGEMTIEEALEHFGVKGMKWGQTTKSNVTRSRAKDFGDAFTARLNVEQKNDQLYRQKKKVKNTKNPEAKLRQEAKLKDMKLSYLKNPDRVTAIKMTKGEAAVALLVTGGLAAPGMALREAVGRTIETRQQTGYYDRKKK